MQSWAEPQGAPDKPFRVYQIIAISVTGRGGGGGASGTCRNNGDAYARLLHSVQLMEVE